jgi:hypothetical protein
MTKVDFTYKEEDNKAIVTAKIEGDPSEYESYIFFIGDNPSLEQRKKMLIQKVAGDMADKIL